MFNIKEELKKLPDTPGVYIMKDKDDKILYIGKAISLKRRVSQYFMKTPKTTRIEKMVSYIDHFEYILTDNEIEALLLECNLIKRHKPKFNVLLKDDKTYPYIKIDIKEDYPNVYITRTLKNDGAKYFGPYANAYAAKEMVQFAHERFQIRQCKNFKSRSRACINYDIKRCLAPCINKISRDDYHKQINQIIMLLEGKTNEIIKELESNMKEYSKNQEYEKAAIIRDRINAITRISEKQKMSNINENSIDVIGLYKNDIETCIEIFFIRKSKMIGREHYFFKNLQDEGIKEILTNFIKQYYIGNNRSPSKIMLQENISEKEIIEKILESNSGKKVEIRVPQKGEKLKLVELAINNAKITLNNKQKDQQGILLELKQKLELVNLPRKIESYDISNLHGDYIVAGMCTAKDGMIDKRLSKIFKIKTVFTQDDPRCLKEVVDRRLKHSIKENKDNFGDCPDVIFADGGITQINAIKEAIEENNLAIPVFGMVKDDKHKTKKLIDADKNEIELSIEALKFIASMQEEVHRIAIGYNRKLHQKDALKSSLDDIEGIGEKRKQELLKKFGSIQAIKNAEIDELTMIKGINRELAKRIKKNLY